MQIRGLLVLLISKAAGHSANSIDFMDAETSAGISQRQRSLAEMTEMIYSAHLIHRGILNLQPHLVAQSKIAQDLHFGNKMSVLSGDFLLASVWKGLGELRNTKVVELMATAIGDFMEGQFVIETESSRPEDHATTVYWEERNFLRVGSLQANSCQSALALAAHDETVQSRGYEFGRNFALAWQAFNEIQPFLRSFNGLTPLVGASGTNVSTNLPTTPVFDLMSAPVLQHIESEGITLDSFRTSGQIDYQKLHSVIAEGAGVAKTHELINSYTTKALDALSHLPSSDAVNALSNIVNAVREQ